MPVPTGPAQTPVAGVSNATTLVLTFATNPTAGHGVSVVVGYQSGTIVSVAGCGATWTKSPASVAPGSCGCDIWVGTNCSGSAKVVTITASASQRLSGNATDWGNIPIAVPFDAGASYTGNTSLNASPQYALTAGYGNVVVIAGLCSQGGTTSGTPTGFTALTGGVSGSLDMRAAYQILTPATGVKFNFAGTGWVVTGSSKVFVSAAASIKGAPRAAIALTSTAAGTSTATGSVSVTANTPVIATNTLPTLEVRVLDGSLATTPQIAILQNARETSWHDPFNDTGAGTTKLPLADPKAVSLVPGNIVSGWLSGVERFRWWADAPVKTIAAPDGQPGEFWEFAGREFEAYCERGIIYPVNGWGPPAGTGTFKINGRGVSGSAFFPPFQQVQKVGPWPTNVYNNLFPYAGEWLIALAEAMQKYTPAMIPFLKWDFTEATDSGGNPWQTHLNLTFNVGQNLLDVIKAIRALGITVSLRKDYTLQAWDLSNASRHLETKVVLRQGSHISGPIQHTRPISQLRTRMLAQGSIGFYAEQISPAQEAIPVIGVRAGYVGGPSAVATGQGTVIYGNPTADNPQGTITWVPGPALFHQPTIIAAAKQALLTSQALTESISVPMNHGFGPGQYEPYAHFAGGDWIALDVPGTWDRAPYQVVAIGIQQAEANGYLPTIDLGTVRRRHLLELQRKLDNAGFGS